MSQFWQPGSVGLFIGPQNCQPAAAIFVGVGVLSPEARFIPYWRKIFSDYGGTMTPSESVFAGENAFISVDLARYNYPASHLIANYLNSAADFAGGGALAASARGAYPFGSKGTLLQTEGLGITVFLQNTNMLQQGAPASFPGQPPGYRFPLTRPVQFTLPGKPLEAGQLLRVAFEAQELLSFSAGGGQGFVAGVPNWLLYDQSVANLPPLN